MKKLLISVVTLYLIDNQHSYYLCITYMNKLTIILREQGLFVFQAFTLLVSSGHYVSFEFVFACMVNFFSEYPWG